MKSQTSGLARTAAAAALKFTLATTLSAAFNVQPSNAATITKDLSGRIIASKDDHTASALKRAADIKPIVANADSEPAVPPKPVVISGPAPGTEGAPATDDTHVEHTDHVSAPAPTPSTKPAASQGTGVSAEQSLRWLTNGNTRYVKRHNRSDGKSATDRKRLLEGQKPHAIVLSCSDSRVPPEVVFDQALGEIFVIRVAGEALDTSVIASIESAVQELSPKLLVVMGHTQCSTVEAALNTKEGESAGSEALDKLIADIRPRLSTVSTEKLSHHLEIESTLNADGVARDLVRRSEIIKKKVESGELTIKPALYRMDSGKVTFY